MNHESMDFMWRYTNPLYDPADPDDAEFMITCTIPIRYNGFYIFHGVAHDDKYNIVLKTVCVSQQTSIKQCKQWIDNNGVVTKLTI